MCNGVAVLETAAGGYHVCTVCHEMLTLEETVTRATRRTHARYVARLDPQTVRSDTRYSRFRRAA